MALAATLLHLGQKREDSFVSRFTVENLSSGKQKPGTATVVWKVKPWGYTAPEYQICVGINAPATFLMAPIYIVAGDRADEIPPLLVRTIYLTLVGVFWFWLGTRILDRTEPRRSSFLLLLATISLLSAALGLFLMTQTYWGHSGLAFLGICIWLLVLGVWASRYLWRTRGLRAAP